MLGYTGTYKGKRVSVQGTGMGVPSISIYVHELIQEYGCKTLIRVGSCGSMQEHIKVRDVIVAMSAATDSNFNRLNLVKWIMLLLLILILLVSLWLCKKQEHASMGR